MYRYTIKLSAGFFYNDIDIVFESKEKLNTKDKIINYLFKIFDIKVMSVNYINILKFEYYLSK